MENKKTIWFCDEDEGERSFVDNVEGIFFDINCGHWDGDIWHDETEINMFIGDEWIQVRGDNCNGLGYPCGYCKKVNGPLAWHAARKKNADLQAKLYKEFETLPPKSTQRCFQTISRNGQPKMRQELLREFNAVCPATGENNDVYLEAAHLVPYRDIHHCKPSNGLLLDVKIHKALDNGHLTYDGHGQLWRREKFNACHLHITCAKLPPRVLTSERKKWLQKAHVLWLQHHNIDEEQLQQVSVTVHKAELEESDRPKKKRKNFLGHVLPSE